MYTVILLPLLSCSVKKTVPTPRSRPRRAARRRRAVPPRRAGGELHAGRCELPRQLCRPASPPEATTILPSARGAVAAAGCQVTCHRRDRPPECRLGPPAWAGNSRDSGRDPPPPPVCRATRFPGTTRGSLRATTTTTSRRTRPLALRPCPAAAEPWHAGGEASPAPGHPCSHVLVPRPAHEVTIELMSE